MNILGINAYHADAAAAIVVNGELIAAVEEERFRRIKHWAGLPTESIKYCLSAANIDFSQIDAIAINQDAKANLWKKIGFTLAKRPDLKLAIDSIKNKRERESVDEQLAQVFKLPFNGQVHAIEHHHAHLSSAFHVSPYEQAVIVSVDGFGDFASGAWGVGQAQTINIDKRIYFPHSLGIFYQALTQYLGFFNYGDEYKVMGLAPYGDARFLPEMQQIVLLQSDGSYQLNLKYFKHHQEKVAYEWDDGYPKVGQLFANELTTLLGPARQSNEPLTEKHYQIAHSIQAMYEQAFFHLLNTLHQRYHIDQLALCGGCAMNSVANGKVYRETPFKQVYIQSAAGDAGGAIGAAFSVWAKQPKAKQHFVMDHAYWGPEFSHQQIADAIAENQLDLEQAKCDITEYTDETSLCQRTAAAIADGKVIGWFQGRMEWGPRALGNRSIIGDPRRADMKDILNQKIKRRESFRPFAPSILREAVSEWFEEDDDVLFMMQVFQIRQEKRSKIPAVTHVDGSGRLQTVFEKTNPRYYHLIQAFQQLTDVPLVLNTSFNENEPVVCLPQEALACFLRTKMDVLVLGDYFIERII